MMAYSIPLEQQGAANSRAFFFASTLREALQQVQDAGLDCGFGPITCMDMTDFDCSPTHCSTSWNLH